MMLAHQQQLVAWEQDRHRILVLEQKLAKAEGEKSFLKIVAAMKGFFCVNIVKHKFLYVLACVVRTEK